MRMFSYLSKKHHPAYHEAGNERPNHLSEGDMEVAKYGNAIILYPRSTKRQTRRKTT